MNPGRVHKVLGTETEFGITIRNQPDFNPVLASSRVVNAYAGTSSRIEWSFEDEAPGRDARGFGYEPSAAADFDTGLANTVLTNGARFYVDHAHPEYSSPECYDPLEAALYDKAGELVLARAARAVQAALPDGERLLIHKNNSDGKGNSYGAHENVLVSRRVPFGDLVAHLLGFLATRQVFTGSGKVGAENGRPRVPFQISQRADFFEEEVGLETTLKRPIVNTRDEPHADPGSYRRLHVIIGDATRSEVQTFVKLGSLAMFLAALEDGALGDPVLLADPVESVWRISHDPSLRHAVPLDGGGTITALDLQWRYLEAVAAHAEAEGADDIHRRVLDDWESILTDLEADPLSTADRLDWTAKLRLLEGYRDRDGLGWKDPKLRLLDLQYHDVEPARGLYDRLAAAGTMRRVFTDDEIERAADEPPERTRAYFRGRCIARFPGDVVAANWDSMIFDVGEDSLKRVPMMEPLRGGKDRVGDLIAAAGTAADLVKALGGD
ncbi:MAG: proteasome accessory factor PafA2 [Actinobacteria bacterium]|nr:proteasome accessory factor PafA2 [Actinomycetota bacterium]